MRGKHIVILSQACVLYFFHCFYRAKWCQSCTYTKPFVVSPNRAEKKRIENRKKRWRRDFRILFGYGRCDLEIVKTVFFGSCNSLRFTNKKTVPNCLLRFRRNDVSPARGTQPKKGRHALASRAVSLGETSCWTTGSNARALGPCPRTLWDFMCWVFWKQECGPSNLAMNNGQCAFFSSWRSPTSPSRFGILGLLCRRHVSRRFHHLLVVSKAENVRELRESMRKLAGNDSRKSLATISSRKLAKAIQAESCEKLAKGPSFRNAWLQNRKLRFAKGHG